MANRKKTAQSKTNSFLKQLNREIWKQEGFLSFQPNMSGEEYTVPNIVKVRDLEKEEFDKIVEAIKGGCLVSIESSNYGFRFSLYFWAPLAADVKKKKRKQPPKPLLVFESSQVPPCSVNARKNALPSSHDDHVWYFFEPYLHNPKNMEGLRLQDISLPGDREDYEY